MKTRAWAWAWAGLLLALTAPAWAGRGMGWGRGGAYARHFDPKTVETVEGVVSEVRRLAPMKGMGPGVHLTLKTDKESLDVHLGPAWFLDRQDVELRKGDKVSVKGSRVSFEGKPALVAVRLVMGEEVLTLRDEEGFPAWSGWRRRR